MNILIQQPFTIIIELIAITAFILILDRSFCFGNICFKSYCVKRLVEDFFFFFLFSINSYDSDGYPCHRREPPGYECSHVSIAESLSSAGRFVWNVV